MNTEKVIAKNRIVEEDFNKWRKNASLIYASETVTVNKEGTNLLHLLRFYVFLNGRYEVTYKGDLLYKGYSFDKAAKAYHTCSIQI